MNKGSSASRRRYFSDASNLPEVPLNNLGRTITRTTTNARVMYDGFLSR